MYKCIEGHRGTTGSLGYHSHGTRSAFDRESNRLADLAAEGWHIIGFTTHFDT